VSVSSPQPPLDDICLPLDGTEHYVARDAIVASPLGDGLALLDPQTSSYFTLNRSASVMWACAAKPVSLSVLRTALAGAFGRSEAAVDEDARSALRDLVAARLFRVVIL
jgi:hypothetical protein